MKSDLSQGLSPVRIGLCLENIGYLHGIYCIIPPPVVINCPVILVIMIIIIRRSRLQNIGIIVYGFVFIRQPEITLIAPTGSPAVFDQPGPVHRRHCLKILFSVSVIPPYNGDCVIRAYLTIAILSRRTGVIILRIRIIGNTCRTMIHNRLFYTCRIRQVIDICILKMNNILSVSALHRIRQ